MIARVLIALALLFPGAAALANSVVVKAGEHPGFTRLLLEFDILPEWHGVASPGGYRLSFGAGSELEFDLSRVFRLIDRERIGNLRAIDGAVEIDLACDCEVETFETATQGLAVDVRSRSTAVRAASAMPQPIPPRIAELDIRLPGPSIGAPLRAVPAKPTGPAGARLFDPGGLVRTSSLPLLLEELDSFISDGSNSAAVSLLGREFSRAAAQGLVAANPDIESRPEAAMANRMGGLGNRANLAVTTAIDQAITPQDESLAPTEEGAICLSDRRVDVASWGDASDGLNLGRLRSEIVAEDGTVRAAGAHKLARYYLALGFGAEASVAAKWVQNKAERELLEALASIMDKGHSDSAILAGQLHCEGAVALWAALAAPIASYDRPASTDFILSTFSALPPHLRAHLGPLLSERLRSAGLGEEARTAVNAVTRGGGKTEESELATARLDLTGTRANNARQTLADLSQGTDVTAAEALLELLKDAEARDMAPNPAWVEDAPSLVRAIEGTETAVALTLAGLRGRIALGRFDSFREGVVNDSPGLNDTSRRQLAALALAAAAEKADDGTLIETEIGLSRLAPPEVLDRMTRFAMADRLFRIGLSNRAANYLTQDASTPEELRVAANVMVAVGRAEEAADLLADSGNPDLAAQLGDVLVAAGQDARARDAFAASGRLPDAFSAALRTADWQWIAESGIEGVAEATGALLKPKTAPAATDAPNGDLIRASRELRGDAATLLDATRPATTGPAFTN